MGKSKTRQTTSSSNTFDKWVGQHSQDIAGQAASLAGQNPFNEMHRQAYGMASDTSNPFLSQMANTSLASLQGNPFTGESAQPFIDKYIEASAPALQDATDTMHAALNNQRASAGSAFGGSRSFLADAAIGQGAARARGNIFSNAINQGMGMGFNAHNANLQNQRAGFGMFGNAAGQMQNIRNSQFGNLLAGAQNKFSQPWQNLSNRASVFGSVPKNQYSSGSTTTTKPSNVLGNVLGLAGTIGGAVLGGPIGASIGSSLFGGAEAAAGVPVGNVPGMTTLLPKPKPFG